MRVSVMSLHSVFVVAAVVLTCRATGGGAGDALSRRRPINWARVRDSECVGKSPRAGGKTYRRRCGVFTSRGLAKARKIFRAARRRELISRRVIKRVRPAQGFFPKPSFSELRGETILKTNRTSPAAQGPAHSSRSCCSPHRRRRAAPPTGPSGAARRATASRPRRGCPRSGRPRAKVSRGRRPTAGARRRS